MLTARNLPLHQRPLSEMRGVRKCSTINRLVVVNTAVSEHRCISSPKYTRVHSFLQLFMQSVERNSYR